MRILKYRGKKAPDFITVHVCHQLLQFKKSNVTNISVEYGSFTALHKRLLQLN